MSNSEILYGTIVSDCYKKENHIDFYKSITIICDEKEPHFFNNTGVYFYWNYQTKEILYIGSFKELLDKNINNKLLEQLNEYFKKNEKLGVSLLLQNDNSLYKSYLNNIKEIKFSMEILFIACYKLQYGKVPDWNQLFQEKKNNKVFNKKDYGDIFLNITLQKVNELNAKSTLREISSSNSIKENESKLHVFRMLMSKYNLSFEQAKNHIYSILKLGIKLGNESAFKQFLEIESLVKSNYMKKKLVL